MKNIPQKSRFMIEYLQSKILAGEYPSNRQLPTVRELMRQFSLSNSSVKRGIDYLASIGLLETRRGAGIFVRSANVKRPPKGHLRIAVFAPASIGVGERQGVFPTVFAGMKAAAEHSESSLILHHVRTEGFSEAQLRALSDGADAVVFLLELGQYPQEINLKCPSVGVCMHSSSVKSMSFVDIDPFSAADDAVDYFMARRSRKMAVVSADYPAFMNRANIFADTWRRAAGSKATLLISNRFDALEFEKGTAYYFCTGTLLQEQSELYYARVGRYLSEDFTVLGVDGKNLINHDFHPAPSVALHWEDAGHAAFDECQRRIAFPGSAPRRIYLRGHLVSDD